MKTALFPALFLLAACAESPTQQTPAPTTPTLTKLWVTAGFNAPEGVAAAPQGGYFISNVAGDGGERDAHGWISLISADGAMITERFIDGLNAPKGMVVLDNEIYIADIDRIVVHDASNGNFERVIAVPGASFLNDATVWRGNVYVSDSRNARIHQINMDSAPIWLEDERLGGVNGLLGDGERMLITTMRSGSIYETGPQKTLTQVTAGIIDADGIGLAPGGYLTSAWRGDIFYVTTDGEKTKFIDTRDEEILQNDLSVFGDLVIVPNWQPGTVTGWRIE